VDTLQHLAGLTAAGTAPDFNRIPFKRGGTLNRAGDRGLKIVLIHRQWGWLLIVNGKL